MFSHSPIDLCSASRVKCSSGLPRSGESRAEEGLAIHQGQRQEVEGFV